MRERCTSGSVREAPSDRRLYSTLHPDAVPYRSEFQGAHIASNDMLRLG